VVAPVVATMSFDIDPVGVLFLLLAALMGVAAIVFARES
jgi:hypothetical protein